jgi:hypothetical protein
MGAEMNTATNRVLVGIDEASRIVATGMPLLVAGSEDALRALPRGPWIGGTIPYFMGDDGGCHATDRVLVTPLDSVDLHAIRFYDASQLSRVMLDAPTNGFSVVILPFDTLVHRQFAEHAADYEGMFLKPIVGWVAGTDLRQVGTVRAKVFNGESGECDDMRAVVMHVGLPPNKIAHVEIVNIFDQGNGDILTFPTLGFEIEACSVNGVEQQFADYLVKHQIDTRLPLVADYHGALINTSIQQVDAPHGVVRCYAPVFPGIEYRVANPVPDYAAAFEAAVPPAAREAVFACNCILNYVYGGLEGKQTGLKGPITFGEIAYQLVNQTLVYLVVEAA